MKRGTYRAMLFLMVTVFGIVMVFDTARALAAGLQPQEMTGTVKFAVAAGAPWQTLTPDSIIQTGYRLQTGAQSVASLQAEDGSVVFLGENTELTVLAIAGNPRDYRFSLLKGTLLIEATKGRADNERIEIETPLVVTKAVSPNVQATSLQVVYDPATPACHVYGFQGKITFRQLVDAVSDVSGLFGMRGERNEGISFPVNRKDAEVTLEVLTDQSTIVVQTNVPTDQLIAMLGEYIGMETTYLDEDEKAPLELSISEDKTPLVLKKKDERAMIVTAPANVVHGAAPAWLFARFRFFKEFGDNGYLWFRDDCECVEMLWEEEGLTPLGFGPARVTAAAGLQPQEMTGMVKFAVAAGAPWQTLTKDTTIQTGYRLQTGAQSVVSLQAEDGSVVFLGENTELTVLAIAGNPREYRFSLLKGTLLIEATKGQADDERIEIETPLVITKAVNPNVQVTVLQVVYDPATPACHVYDFQGKIAFLQLVNGVSDVSGLFGMRGERNEGISFPVNRKDAEVTMEVLAEKATVVVQTNQPIDKLRAMLGEYIGMETTYLDEDEKAPLELLVSENKRPLVLKKKNERAMIITAPANVVHGAAPVWLFARFRFFKEFGDNGYLWFRDDCGCVELYWEEELPPLVPESTPPNVQTPPPNPQPSPQPSPQPTPSPTPQPTPRPTPLPTPRPTPTSQPGSPIMPSP